ncbi:MAG: hypothetical protein KC543_08380 [Myxococcales bacterium]|nr:hypothetical protein [Myxococcales bacterium]
MRNTRRTGWARAALVLTAVACVAASLALPERGAAAPSPVLYRRVRVDGFDGKRTTAVVTVPRRRGGRTAPPGHRYPTVVALHDASALARRGAGRAYTAWAGDYGLPVAFAALASGHVTAESYGGTASEAHLAYVNAALAAKPFPGALVINPVVPELSEAQVKAYGDWLAGPLLAAVRERFAGAARTREGTGIDGLRDGGTLALEVGLSHPDVFGAVGALQPSLDTAAIDRIATLAAARDEKLEQAVRLLTAKDGASFAGVQTLSAKLRAAHVPHRVTELAAAKPEAYESGADALELLRFQTTALVSEARH